MKTTKILTVVATLIVALSLAAPASASCGTVAAIASVGDPAVVGQSGYTFVFSPVFQEFGPVFGASYGLVSSSNAGNPAPPSVSGAATVSFWALGAGDPAVGPGTDNGGFDLVGYPGFYGAGYSSGPSYAGGLWYAATINGTWEAAGIDGCIGSGNCMCLLISDHDGERGFWAVTGGQSDANFNTSINQGGADGNGNNLPIILATMPKPSITASTRAADGSLDVEVTVKLPAPTGGDFTNDGCGCAPIGYRVLQQVLTSGSMPPTDRGVSVWSEPALAAGGAQGVTSFGVGAGDAGVTIRSACGASDTDVYLTAQLVFDSGFATTVVSGNSSRVECGPNLADPDDRPSRIRPRSDRPATPRRR